MLRQFSRINSLSARTITLMQKRHLPVCTIDTNLERHEVPKDFNKKLSQFICSTLNKPSEFTAVVLRTSIDVVKEGTDSPAALVNIWSIGVFDEIKNPQHSKVFFEFLTKELNLPHNRISLLFHSIQKSNAGHLLYNDLLNEGKA